MKHSVYLILGSNIDRETNFPRAVQMLAGLGRITAVSTVFETAPVGMAGAADFFNGAVRLETDLEPEDLKQRLITDIEAPLGRERVPGKKFVPRTIDVDIALWNDEVRTVGGNPVPDPDILRHLHVAEPLAEINGALVHPVDGRTLAAIVADLRRTGDPLPRPRPDIILDW